MTDTDFVRLLKSPVVWLTAGATAIVTLTAVWPDMPAWLTIIFAVVLAVLGVFGVTARVTPVKDPRGADGVPLVPAEPR